MRIESRPATLIAAQYDQFPFPLLAPRQEVTFDLGITATDAALTLRGVVFQGYNEHQLLFEEQWPARIIRKHVHDDDLRIASGTGLALRGLHFLVHGYESLTHVTVTVIAEVDGREGTGQMELQIPVRYHTGKTDLHFPLRGAWWAIQGSDWSDQHKREVFSQTYAMDFVRLGPDNRFFRGTGLQREDHYSWDQPVYATAGGKVSLVIYDMPDLLPGQPPDPRMFRGEPWRTLGNAVAVSHGNGECSYFASLQQASLAVNQGQMIKRGALLGRVGNSGLSPGPHLHFHLAEGPNPFIDQGLPVKFSHFEAGGQQFTQPIAVPTRMILIGPDTPTL
jgi:hypothetical protein